jgi:hypothetical protein
MPHNQWREKFSHSKMEKIYFFFQFLELCDIFLIKNKVLWFFFYNIKNVDGQVVSWVLIWVDMFLGEKKGRGGGYCNNKT